MWTITKPIKPSPVRAITYFAPNEERHGRSSTFINTLLVPPRRIGGSVAGPSDVSRYPLLSFYRRGGTEREGAIRFRYLPALNDESAVRKSPDALRDTDAS